MTGIVGVAWLQVTHGVFVGMIGIVGVAWLQVTHGVFVGMIGIVGVAWLQVTHGVFVGMTGIVGVAWLQVTHGVAVGGVLCLLRVAVGVHQAHDVEVGMQAAQHVATCVCNTANVPQKSGVATDQVGSKTSVGTTITMVVAVAVAVGVAVSDGNAIGSTAGCCCCFFIEEYIIPKTTARKTSPNTTPTETAPNGILRFLISIFAPFFLNFLFKEPEKYI